MIRAKFRCQSIREFATGIMNGVMQTGEEIELMAVMGPENEPWSKWTPSGNLKFSITNPDAKGKFKVGADYYLDMSPIVPAEATPA